MGDHSEPRIYTSLISGASHMSNSSIKNNTLISKQINIYPPESTSAKIGCASIWVGMQGPIPSFAGREDVLKEVHNAFFPTDKEIKPIHQVAIVGLGGVGKSEFARKFAHTYYPELDKNVIWINAETAQLLTDSFKGLAPRIGIKFEELWGKEDILEMVDQVYKYFAEKKSLFIFDNVEDWVDEENAVIDYLPNRVEPDVQKPFVLMTSRIRPSGAEKTIELSALKESQAVHLIQSRLEITATQCEELQLRLVNILGCLPLALQQAASYIKQQLIEPDISGKSRSELVIWCIESYIEIFESEAKKVLGYKLNAMDIKFEELKTTLLTWRITLNKVESRNPSAIELLKMMSYVSPENIHLKIFEAQFKGDELKWAVNTLFQFSMISKFPDNTSIVSVHRLVQRVIRLDIEEMQEGSQDSEKIRGPDEENKPLESVLYLLNIILGGLPDSIEPYSTSCVIHAQAAWNHALANPKLLKQFTGYLKKLFRLCRIHEMVQGCLPLFQRTLLNYEKHNIFEGKSKQYIETQYLTAWALLRIRNYKEAKLLYNTVQKTAADNLGESDPLTLKILHKLATVDGKLGNYSELTTLEKVIALRTASRKIGPYHEHTLASLRDKGVCLARMGKHDEAYYLLKSTLELQEKYCPKDRRSINHTRYWLAYTTQQQGNFVEARQMLINLHVELVEMFGESHTRTLRCAGQIGVCLLGLGEYEGAMEILKHNMELANKNPSARVQSVHMQYSIAKVLFAMGRHDEGISQLRIVLDKRLSIYEETHPEVLTTRVCLADALQSTGCTGEALQQYQIVYENRVNILGADHPDTIKVKNKMNNPQRTVKFEY